MTNWTHMSALLAGIPDFPRALQGQRGGTVRG